MKVLKTKILCLDPGEKRIGIAISDLERSIAFAFKVIPNDIETIKLILDIAKTEKVGLIVIGKPLYTGKYSKSDEFAQNLQSKGYETAIFNEDFSTSEAIETLTSMGLSDAEINAKKDAYAAQVILQRYIDSLT